MRAQSLSAVIIPLSIIALAIPMILEKIPRNRYYGFRTPFTMSSNEIWYYSNRVSGVAMTLAALFWLLMSLVLTTTMPNSRVALAVAGTLGAVALLAALAISYALTRRKFGK